MEIVKPELTQFKNIYPGDCFTTTATNPPLLMRTEIRDNGIKDNAISLKTGAITTINLDEFVLPVKAKVVVE